MKEYFEAVAIMFSIIVFVFLLFFLVIGPVVVLAYNLELGNIKIVVSILLAYSLIILPLGLPLVVVLHNKIDDMTTKEKE